MPDCAQKYKYTIVESALLRVETRPLTPVNEYPAGSSEPPELLHDHSQSGMREVWIGSRMRCA